MDKSLKESLINRRTYYAISDQSPVSDDEIEEIVMTVAQNVPSAFNSQSTRLVLLLGENHKKLWNIVKETLRKRIPEKNFKSTEDKINNSFSAGYGTVLFFEDKSVVDHLQKQFPLYAEKFPIWSEHTAAMHQLSTWMMLENAGFGASLQHYNPLIDTEVIETWGLDKNWQLTAQMPFGTPLQQPGEKTYQPLEMRVKVFK